MYKDYVSIDFIFRAGTDCCVPIAGAIFKNLLALVETPFSQVQSAGIHVKLFCYFIILPGRKKSKPLATKNIYF